MHSAEIQPVILLKPFLSIIDYLTLTSMGKWLQQKHRIQHTHGTALHALCQTACEQSSLSLTIQHNIVLHFQHAADIVYAEHCSLRVAHL